MNLEGPVGAGKPGGDRLRNGPAVLAALEAVGVAAVTVANNHAADDGPAGLAATRAAAGPVAVLGELASASVAGVEVLAAYEASPEALAAAVQARAPAPVIVTLHVLAPPSYRPSAETRARVEAALAAGAAVVAVHGSHALGAVERRGRQVVAWGLGNLAFACRCTAEDEAMALEVTLSDGEVDAVVVPLRAGLHGAPLALDRSAGGGHPAGGPREQSPGPPGRPSPAGAANRLKRKKNLGMCQASGGGGGLRLRGPDLRRRSGGLRLRGGGPRSGRSGLRSGGLRLRSGGLRLRSGGLRLRRPGLRLRGGGLRLRGRAFGFAAADSAFRLRRAPWPCAHRRPAGRAPPAAPPPGPCSRPRPPSPRAGRR
ncbi:MAG: CapA family protein [bacterium]